MITDREIQRKLAKSEWASLKSGVCYWQSWKYTPTGYFQDGGWHTYRCWLAEMRNAFVCFYIGDGDAQPS